MLLSSGREKIVPLNYITIGRSEYEALLREVKRGVEVCTEVSDLRLKLQVLAGRLLARIDKAAFKDLTHAIDSCDDVLRLRIELLALERRLREFDQELTPIRPPSRTDIKAAFDNSVAYAQGSKKPPPAGGG